MERVPGIRKLQKFFIPEASPIGTVIGLPLRKQPRSAIVDVIQHGVGGCASVDELQKYIGFPAEVTDKYVNPMVEQGLLERRQTTLPKTGEVVDLICFTEEDKQFD